MSKKKNSFLISWIYNIDNQIILCYYYVMCFYIMFINEQRRKKFYYKNWIQGTGVIYTI